MPQAPDIPHSGSAYALTRFFLRLAILSVFAVFSQQGFGRALESMLLLASFYCVVIAVLRQEHPFGRILTHVDEAAGYVMIARLAALAS